MSTVNSTTEAIQIIISDNLFPNESAVVNDAVLTKQSTNDDSITSDDDYDMSQHDILFETHKKNKIQNAIKELNMLEQELITKEHLISEMKNDADKQFFKIRKLYFDIVNPVNIARNISRPDFIHGLVSFNLTIPEQINEMFSHYSYVADIFNHSKFLMNEFLLYKKLCSDLDFNIIGYPLICQHYYNVMESYLETAIKCASELKAYKKELKAKCTQFRSVYSSRLLPEDDKQNKFQIISDSFWQTHDIYPELIIMKNDCETRYKKNLGIFHQINMQYKEKHVLFLQKISEILNETEIPILKKKQGVFAFININMIKISKICMMLSGIILNYVLHLDMIYSWFDVFSLSDAKTESISNINSIYKIFLSYDSDFSSLEKEYAEIIDNIEKSVEFLGTIN
jgi:hypothetical protein